VRRSPTRNHTTTGAEELSAGREEELCAISLEAFLREMRADRVRIPVPTIFPDAFRNRTSADERRTGWMSRGSAPRRPRAVAAGATSAHRADAVHEAISAGGRRRRGERSPAPTNDSWQRGFSGKSPAKNFPRTPRHVTTSDRTLSPHTQTRVPERIAASTRHVDARSANTRAFASADAALADDGDTVDVRVACDDDERPTCAPRPSSREPSGAVHGGDVPEEAAPRARRLRGARRERRRG
jgi:hypothetical protein